MAEPRNQANVAPPRGDDARPPSPVRSLLTDPAFLRIWIAGGLVGTIRWLEVLAVGVYTYQITGSPFIVATMLFARMVPTMLLGAFAGALAERVNRRHLLMAGMLVGVAQLTRVNAVALLPVFQWGFGTAWGWKSTSLTVTVKEIMQVHTDRAQVVCGSGRR